MSFVYPKITWSGDNQSMTFGCPVDNAIAFTKLDSVQVRAPSGEQDSWVHGSRQRAKLTLRWIPSAGTASNQGWHTPAPGVNAWLMHQLQDKDDFTFYPDSTSGTNHVCRLIGTPEVEREAASPVLYKLTIEIEDVTGTEFTEY